MSSFALKILAVFCMLIDHIGYMFIPSKTALYLVFRYIGRLSFPIFCFLLAEGFIRTSDRKKYLLRLCSFALLSEIPFDMAFYGKLITLNKQNIFCTLVLGFLCIWTCEYLRKKHIVLCIFPIAIFTYLANLIRCDYKYYGVILIAFFYLANKKKLISSAGSSAISIIYASLPYLKKNLIMTLLTGKVVPMQIFSAFAFFPIYFYNGKKGAISLKYFFYLFYPLHLVILYIIKLIIQV